MALLDNGQDLSECAIEIGCEVGQLLTPLTRYRLRDPSRKFAIDNGRFSPGWREESFLSLLTREQANQERCLFVTVPDVVGSARRTLEVFDRWHRRLQGWKLALACQDGQEDLDIPWDEIAAVFIGGSTRWKCSEHAGHIIQAAQALGKWTHAGRVNDPGRWEHFENLDVDSIDGTGLARYSHMRKAIASRGDNPTFDFKPQR